MKIETTICNEIRQSGEPVIINHVAEDAAWRGHHTPALYGFQSYISMPIVLRDGAFFGTLCAIDPRPARLDRPEIVGMFRLFADLIAFHLDASERLASTEARLSDERETAELREQFIAVLGHDLRNPLASIDAGARLLARETLSRKGRDITALMASSVERMAALIDNVTDFARGRLSRSLALARAELDLAPLLAQIIAELRAARPGRAIETDIALTGPPGLRRDADRAAVFQSPGQRPGPRGGGRAGPCARPRRRGRLRNWPWATRARKSPRPPSPVYSAPSSAARPPGARRASA